MSVEQRLAKKYAKAWLAVYPKAITLEQIEPLTNVCKFFHDHHHIGFHLKLSVIPQEKKRAVLDQIIDQFGLPKELDSLVTLLLAHKRSFLFGLVVEQIVALYKKENKIQSFIFASPTELDDRSCEEIQGFLAAKTGCVIIYEKRIDATLIAGIRLQSNTLLWECSVAQQLRVLRQALTQ